MENENKKSEVQENRKLRKEWVDGYCDMKDSFTVMGILDTELNERELRAALRHSILAREKDNERHGRSMQLMEALGMMR